MKTIEGCYGFGYQECLEAAGATIHAFKEFGSYQGDWWAKVTLEDGRQGWVHGYYGSCSGCDALQATFDYGFGNRDYEAKTTTYTDEEWEKLVAFGESELEDFYESVEEALKEAGKHSEWDMEAKEAVAWLEASA
jgi:hypothetical protein